MEKVRWENAWANAKLGKLDDIDKDICIRQYSQLRSIARDFLPIVPDGDGVCGIWVYGISGSGKSRYVRDTYPDLYDKMCNKWWDGYRGEQHVLLDDFDKAHSCLGHHLKRWTDRYSFRAEIKGTSMQLRPKLVIVTSQYKIEDIWSDDETRDALNRRFKKIHIANLKVTDDT